MSNVTPKECEKVNDSNCEKNTPKESEIVAKNKDESNGGFPTDDDDDSVDIYKKCTLCDNMILKSSKLHFQLYHKGIKEESPLSDTVVSVSGERVKVNTTSDFLERDPPSPSLSECSTLLLSDMSDEEHFNKD